MHALVLDFNAMLRDSNARLWYVNAILSYGVCCKKYAWTDCMSLFS